MVRAAGIGSGLDVESIVSQLIEAEAAPTTTRLNRNESTFQSKISAFGSLKGALADFQKSLTGLKDLSALRSRTVKVSDETLLSARAGDAAVAGVYQVEVVALARPQRLMSSGYATSATTVGTGTITVTAGTESFDVVIDTDHQTLAGVRDAINQAEGNDAVDATIITTDDGLGGQVSRLVLSARKPGLANALQLEITNDGDAQNLDTAGLSALTWDPGVTQNLTEQETALDARIKVFGQDVTRTTNSISDAIEGITLDLTKAAPGTTATVTVAEDRTALRDRVNLFVKSYNAAIDSMRKLSKYDSVSRVKGPLVGDPTLRTIESRVRRMVTESVGGDGTFQRLSDVGIQINADGLFEVDEEDLQTALDGSFADVGALFGGEGGFGEKLETLLDDYTDTTGILQTRLDSFNKGIADIGKARTALQSRLDSLEERYRAEFDALDSIVSQLTSTSGFLTQQLAALPGFTRRSR